MPYILKPTHQTLHFTDPLFTSNARTCEQTIKRRQQTLKSLPVYVM